MQRLGEGGTAVGVHFALSKFVFTQSRGAAWWPGLDERERKKRRALVCFAVTLFLLSSRLQAKTKTLLTMGTLVRMFNVWGYPGMDTKLACLALFTPLASIEWTMWLPSLRGEDHLHPGFSQTLGRLMGFRNKQETIEFARNPKMPVPPDVVQRILGYSLRVLFQVYAIPAITKFVRLPAKERTAPVLANLLATATFRALRTAVIYLFCALYSRAAYWYFDEPYNILIPAPGTLSFYFEPLSRYQSMTEFYMMQFLAVYYQRFRVVAAGSGPASFSGCS
eukprot:gene17650-27160_t